MAIFCKIASALSYLPWEASHLGDSGTWLIIKSPKIVGRDVVIVSFRQSGIKYAKRPRDATANAKNICTIVPTKPVVTENSKVECYLNASTGDQNVEQ